MFNLNSVQLAGNVTRDVQCRQLGPDNQVANFGLAINRRYKDKAGDLKEEVTFLDIECWSKLAEIVSQYVSKGSPVYISGRLKLDQWEDKDGQKRSKIKVVADSVQFLGKPKEETQAIAKPAAGGSRAPASAGMGDSEPPFNRYVGADA